MVGNYGVDSILWVSSNAANWTPISVAGMGLYSAAFAGGRWFAGGMIGYLASSLDGLNWSLQKLEDGMINDVAFGNNVYVAAGNGSFWISTDGETFEQINITCDSATDCPGVWPPDSTFPLSALVAVDTIFFAQQSFFARSFSSGYNYVSTNGRQWQATSSVQLFPDIFVGGRYLAFDADGGVHESANGTLRELRTSLSDLNPASLSCATNRCFVWQTNVILVPDR